MQKPAYDPGLTRQYGAQLRRAINKDGTFNVRRTGVSWRAFHPWLKVVNMSWTGFTLLVLATYVGLNTLFGFVYFLFPPDSVQGSEARDETGRLLNDFFFSGHTLTTVGYGNLAPHGIAANVTATLEALVGLLTFSIITGFLVARVSRPSARIGYSRNVLVSPYNGGTAVMFRIANERSYHLMELKAQVTLMSVVRSDNLDVPERRFDILTLERDSIVLFPLTWTIVHPIDDNSPFHGKTAADLAALQVELIIMVKGFDETFGQTVHSRYSYRYDEFVWDARFRPAFRVEESGDLLLEVDKLGVYTKVAAKS
jgi:inward rectifier potassium channel